MEEKVIANIPNEMLFVGALYSDTELFVNYSRLVVSKYDFEDKLAKFFFDMGDLMFTTFSQEFNENSVNTFMIQEEERKKTYRMYGGWKNIKQAMDISNKEDIENYYNTLKKYSLLREYSRLGCDGLIKRLMELKQFPKLNANQISQMVRGKFDKTSTVIMVEKDSECISDNATQKVMNFITAPMIGTPLPFEIINSDIKGLMKERTIGFGMLSNGGKSRLFMDIACYLILCQDKKVGFFSNEMDSQRMFTCMITTIFNSKDIQKKYGWKLDRTENDTKLARYRNEKGEYINREYGTDGVPVLTDEEYVQYLKENSPEFNEVMKVTEFVENKMKNQLYFKNVGDDYSDETLIHEITKHHKLYNIEFFFYDTLKCYLKEDWTLMKQTATQLSNTVNRLKATLLFNCQLTDDAIHIDPLDLSSLNVASCKGIKHVADVLFLCKEIINSELYLYEYNQIDENWGDSCWTDLDPKFRWMVFKNDKTRDGDKTNVVMRFDLNRNTWVEYGEIRKKYIDKKKK